MTPRAPLPDDLQREPFDRERALRAGVSAGRLRRKDLRRPFHGVRTTTAPSTAQERCSVYAVRLKPGQFFSHASAAALHGLPLPMDLEADPTVHVGALLPADAPHSRGVRGHRLQSAVVTSRHGLPVVDEVEAFCQLGTVLDLEELVMIADVLLIRSSRDVDELRSDLLDRIAVMRRTGGAKLVRAVGLARRGSRSPAETRVRVILVSARIPEPELNAPIHHSQTGAYLGSPDLVWREARVVLEYEGDGHRVDRDQFRYDIARYDRLAADGWRVLRATGDDLTAEGRRNLVTRVRRALETASNRD